MSIARYAATGHSEDAVGGSDIQITVVVDFISQDVLVETPGSWFLMDRPAALALAGHILDSLGEPDAGE